MFGFTVYLYHEVSQLFKKEARDFCILQSERIEGTKFVISMRSVGWPGCSETSSTVRGKVRWPTDLKAEYLTWDFPILLYLFTVRRPLRCCIYVLVSFEWMDHWAMCKWRQGLLHGDIYCTGKLLNCSCISACYCHSMIFSEKQTMVLNSLLRCRYKVIPDREKGECSHLLLTVWPS